MNLTFKVNQQTITKENTGEVPRIGSRVYLYLVFTFSEDWTDLTKTLYISDGTYTDVINIEALTPVLVPNYYTQNASFTITLIGTHENTVVPTNVVTCLLEQSNEVWEEVAPNPDSITYQQLIEALSKIESIDDTMLLAQKYAEDAANSAKQAKEELSTVNESIKAVKDALELGESSKTNFSVTDATEYDYANDKYPSPVDGQYYALNNSSLISECQQIYHDSIQPTMAICFNHENKYQVGIDPTTLTDSEDKATYQHLPGVISLYKNKYLHRMSRCKESYYQRMRLICSLSPVNGWNGSVPVFKKAKNFKTSFVFGFLPPTGYTSENTSLRNTMIFGFRQSSPSKFVNHFKKVNKNQCLLTVSKNGYYFAFGDNINDGEVYIASNLDFSNSFETPLTAQNCLFEIEVVNDKCHVMIHNGELTTSPIYFDHTFDCPYYNPDTEDGSGYIGYGIGAYTGMFGDIELTVLYDNKYKETASKEYVEEEINKLKTSDQQKLDKPQEGPTEAGQVLTAVYDAELPSFNTKWASISFPSSNVKTFANMFSQYTDLEHKTIYIDLVAETGNKYAILSVSVRLVSGEEILCDVNTYDFWNSGNSDTGSVSIHFSEFPNLPVIVRIVYTEE